MNARRIVRIIVPILILFGVAYTLSQTNDRRGSRAGREISYSQFIEAVNENNVLNGDFDKRYFQGHLTRNDAAFTVYLPPESSQEYTLLIARLQAHGVRFGFREPMFSDSVVAMVVSVILPLIVIFFFWMFFLRQAQRSGTGRP